MCVGARQDGTVEQSRPLEIVDEQRLAAGLLFAVAARNAASDRLEGRVHGASPAAAVAAAATIFA